MPSPYTANPNYCCIQDWAGGGSGNTAQDPKMFFPGAGNIHLEGGSPCINAGVSVSGMTEDYEGNARPYSGSAFDIGADEWTGQAAQTRPTGFTVVPNDREVNEVTMHVNSSPGPYYIYWANQPEGPYALTPNEAAGMEGPYSYYGVDFPHRNVTPGPRYYWCLAVAGPNRTAASGPTPPVEATVMRNVVIDPGHGGGTGTSAEFAGQRHTEDEETWYLSNLVKDAAEDSLSQWRYQVVPTKNLESANPDLNVRAQFAYDYNASLFLSIHFNSSESTSPHQMLSLVYRLDRRDEYHDDPRTPSRTAQEVFDHDFDQYNQRADVLFAEGITTRALEGYNRVGLQAQLAPETVPGVRYQYSERDQYGNPCVGHWGVLRDSYLWRQPKEDPSEWRYPIPAAILEVNFLDNYTFFDKWFFAGTRYTVHLNTAGAIAAGLAKALDDRSLRMLLSPTGLAP
jgi:N-acetylmuramoyl-L-alanine amidase